MSSLPRLWRLWSFPAPQSRWLRSGSLRVVCYAEGVPGSMVIVWRRSGQWTGSFQRSSLAEWRRWWLFAEEDLVG